jgi:thiamine-phosphate pyrophosphorylase
MITLITDRKICSKLIEKIKDLNSNLDQIIIREKDLSNEKLFKLYNEILAVSDNTRIIVNSNEEFIKLYNIESFHLSQKNFCLIDKSLLVDNFFGVSVHNISEVKEVLKYNPNYILVSLIFKSKCKIGVEAHGVEILNEIKEITDTKIIALGGIDEKNRQILAENGFYNVAMRSYLLT